MVHTSSLEVKTFNVQHGDCHAIITPSKKVIFIDLGIGDSFSPYKWLCSSNNQIDFLIITHPHDDHIRGILEFESWGKIKRFCRRRDIQPELLSKLDRELKSKWDLMNSHFSNPIDKTQDDFYKSLRQDEVTISSFQIPPQECSTNLNNYSLITLVKWMSVKLLFCGDMTSSGWDYLMQTNSDFVSAIQKCDVLYAPHHAREEGWSSDFVKNVAPTITIVSDGKEKSTNISSAYSNLTTGMEIRKDEVFSFESKIAKVISTRKNGHIRVTATHRINTSDPYKLSSPLSTSVYVEKF